MDGLGDQESAGTNIDPVATMFHTTQGTSVYMY